MLVPDSEAAPAVASVRRMLLLSAVLAVATLALYSPVGRHPFIDYDDQDYVVNNTHIQDGLSWPAITWAFSGTYQSNWHPLTWLSHALDVQLYGINPGGHHWTNLLLHTINVVLLFLLLGYATRAPWRSFLVAALFALHPLNVESVAWIAERKNVLSTLFFLLALGAYGWYARNPGWRRYVLLAALFVCGLASKPMVITLPFVLPLMDVWPLRRVESWSAPSATFPVGQKKFWPLALEKLPLLALSAGSAVITILAQRDAVVATTLLPLEVRLVDAIYAYGMYLWKTIWPAHLALIYPHPGRTLAWWQPALAALVIIVLSIATWLRRREQPYLLVGWLWFLGTAVPIIGIMQVGVQVIADRYAYLPLIGIFLMLAWWAGDLAGRVKVPLQARAVVVTAVLAVLSFMTWRQIRYWRNSVDLWTHALQVTERNSVAENLLSEELFILGRYGEGMEHLKKYSELEPLDVAAHTRLGAEYQDSGRLPDAVQEYEAAIRAEETVTRSGVAGLGPGATAITYANLAIIASQLGDANKAHENIGKAIRSDPQAIQDMLRNLIQAIAAHPSAEGYVRLARLLNLLGHTSEAMQALARAQQLNPNFAEPASTTNGAQH